MEEKIIRTNRIFRFPSPFCSIDLVRYAKSNELREVLGNYLPYESASRSIADIIISGKVRSRRDFNFVRAEAMDLYWLDRRPSYQSILDASPVTAKTLKFFRRFGILMKPRILSNRGEFVKIDKTLEELATVLVLRRVTKGKLCNACGKRVASRLLRIAAEPVLVCDQCYDLFSEI